MTPDWSLMLSRMQREYSLDELSAVFGCHRDRLNKLKAGTIPKWDLALKILVLYDHMAGASETGRVLDNIRLRVLANLEGDEPRAERARRVAADRASRVRAMGPLSALQVAAGEVVQHPGGSETCG